MERIWAPWRVTYVSEVIGKTRGCIFCRILKEGRDRENLIVLRRPTCFAVLNLYPYNNGHTLVMPARHVRDIDLLTPAESADVFSLLCYTKGLLQTVLQPDGFNIGLNLGRAGGAGVPGHIHWHMVPRWKGDVNFMPVTANTKVISQSLRALHTRLCTEHRRREKAAPAVRKASAAS